MFIKTNPIKKRPFKELALDENDKKLKNVRNLKLKGREDQDGKNIHKLIPKTEVFNATLDHLIQESQQPDKDKKG